MTYPTKPTRFIDKLQSFVRLLDEEKSFTVHQQISQFYYMQKVAELIILHEQYVLACKRVNALTSQIDRECTSVFSQWKHDVRWLHTYIQTNPKRRLPS